MERSPAMGSSLYGKGDTMAVTLQDPTRQRDPSSRHAFPDIVGEPAMRARRTLAEELLALSQPQTDVHAREDVPVDHAEAMMG
jgi:hypothetical protein